MKILLIDNDDALVSVLTKRLADRQFVVDVVTDGETGWTYGSTFEYDLIMMELMLPKLDGISLCQRFRAEGDTTPILLLAAESTSTVKVRALDAGADDYVVKPFDEAELMARIRALLRRSSSNPFPLLTWGDLILNPSTCEVTYNDQPLTLTAKEYELIELFLRDSQHVFGTDEILNRLWSSEEFPAEATVRSHIRRLRQKLTDAGAPPDFIATVHGRGYYLKASSEREHSLLTDHSINPPIQPFDFLQEAARMPLTTGGSHTSEEIAPAEAKVMIVDADHAWLRTLPQLLQPWGFKVTTLADPQQFWTVLQAVVPDALVLDIYIPGINGLELCQTLRNEPQWQQLPILCLSTLTDTTAQHQVFYAGADDYLCKPVASSDLAKRILNRLKRIRAIVKA